MNTKQVSSLQISVLTFFLSKACIFPIASSIILNPIKQNIWYSLIIGFLIGLLPLFIYLFINKYDKNLNIIKLNTKIFGSIIGNILNFLISLGVLISGTIMLFALSNFIFQNLLINSPMFLISGLFLIIIFYGAIKGIETICRTSQILFLFNIILFLIGFLALLYYVDFNNFKPILSTSITNIFKSSYNYMLFGVSSVFILSIIPYKVILIKENYNRNILFGYIGAVVITFLGIMSTIGVLGNITTIFQYPSFIAFKQIEYFHFFERVENVLSLQWIFDIFVYLVMIIYFLKKYVGSTFNVYKKKSINLITLLITFIIFMLSNILFSNSLVIKNLIINNYSFITLISFIIIPIIIFIRLKCINHRKYS